MRAAATAISSIGELAVQAPDDGVRGVTAAVSVSLDSRASSRRGRRTPRAPLVRRPLGGGREVGQDDDLSSRPKPIAEDQPIASVPLATPTQWATPAKSA
jgi:hypothetical protein